MCIRDSDGLVEVSDAVRERGAAGGFVRDRVWARDVREASGPDPDLLTVCLLYTSDAADERSSVDLGGPRILKKKNTNITQ